MRASDDASADPLERSFNRAFALVAFITNRQIVDHMARFRRAIGLDFEALLLWAVLAHQNCVHLFPAGHDALAGAERSGPAEACPARCAVSATTAPPRRNHRYPARDDAAEAGGVERSGLVNRDKVGPELREFTFEMVRRLLAAARDVERALKSAEDSVR